MKAKITDANNKAYTLAGLLTSKDKYWQSDTIGRATIDKHTLTKGTLHNAYKDFDTKFLLQEPKAIVDGYDIENVVVHLERFLEFDEMATAYSADCHNVFNMHNASKQQG